MRLRYVSPCWAQEAFKRLKEQLNEPCEHLQKFCDCLQVNYLKGHEHHTNDRSTGNTDLFSTKMYKVHHTAAYLLLSSSSATIFLARSLCAIQVGRHIFVVPQCFVPSLSLETDIFVYTWSAYCTKMYQKPPFFLRNSTMFFPQHLAGKVPSSWPRNLKIEVYLGDFDAVVIQNSSIRNLSTRARWDMEVSKTGALYRP